MKSWFVLLGCITAFTAVGAVPAGLMFLLDTSGASMGQNVGALAHSPFHSFLVPGLFLLIVNGLGQGMASVFSFLRNSRSGVMGLVLGSVLCLWIILQVYWIGFGSWLQAFFLFVGIAEIFLGWKIMQIFRGAV